MHPRVEHQLAVGARRRRRALEERFCALAAAEELRRLPDRSARLQQPAAAAAAAAALVARQPAVLGGEARLVSKQLELDVGADVVPSELEDQVDAEPLQWRRE